MVAVLKVLGSFERSYKGTVKLGRMGASIILRCRFRVVFQHTPVRSFHTMKEQILNARW